MKNGKLEKGQILYIVAIAMVALMAFTALAIDGANLFRERRKDQSTADSAALAGAGKAAQYLKTRLTTTNFSCGNGLDSAAESAAISEAHTSALADNVDLDTNLDDKQGVSTSCGTYNGVPYIDVKVYVTSSVNTYFLKVINKNNNSTTTQAVARIYVTSSYADGNGIVTLGTTCDSNGGIHISGGAAVTENNAGIYSASCISASQGARIIDNGGLIQYYQTDGIKVDKSDPAIILNDLYPGTAPDITSSTQTMYIYTGAKNPAIDSSLWPAQATQALTPMQIPAMAKIDTPTGCTTSRGNVTANSSGATLYPGVYSSLTWSSNGSGDLIFSPGLYCFDGSVSLGSGAAKVHMENSVFYFRSGSTSGLKMGSNALTFYLTGSTIYIENGSIYANQPIYMDNTKVYIAKGDFTYAGSAVVTESHSSIYLNNGNYTITAGAKVSATDITVYVKQGNILADGGTAMNMTAPGCNNSTCGVGPAIYGVLFLMDPTNTGTLTITAGTDPTISGTIYAPNANTTFSGGTTTKAANVQLVAKSVTLSGSGTLKMDTTAAAFYSQSALTINLMK